MSELPSRYAYLEGIGPLPRVVAVALEYYGVTEIKGTRHNPAIMAWVPPLVKAGVLKRGEYSADEIPWCGLFVAHVCQKAGKPVQPGPLWARNWARYGNSADQPRLGDILVFVRNGGGHVGFYVGENATHYAVLGGNQGDKVSIVDIEKSRCIGRRQVPFKSTMPDSYRSYSLTGKGVASINEA